MFLAHRLVFIAFVILLIAPSAAFAAYDLEMTGPLAAGLKLGEPVDVVYTIRNLGPDMAFDVHSWLFSFTQEALRASQGTCDPFDCSLGDLAPGATATMTAIVRAPSYDRIDLGAATGAAGSDSSYANNFAYLFGYVSKTFVVSSTADNFDAFPGDGVCADVNGECTLPAAMQEASISPANDLVHFAIGSGAQTIRFTFSGILAFDDVTVDGTTQPGYKGTPLITLDGSAVPGTTAFSLEGGRATIQGLAILGFNAAIVCRGGSGHVIRKNFLGTDGTNTFGGAAGIMVAPGITHVTIEDNVITGPSTAVTINGINANVRGNRIGTDSTGTLQIGPSFAVGVRIINGANNTVANNVIATRGGGVLAQGAAATGNHIAGNFIGVGADGTAPLPLFGLAVSVNGGRFNAITDNITGTRVQLANAHDNQIARNRIGVTPAGASLGNTGPGVFVQGERNSIAENTIAFNGQQGIVLFGSATGTTIRANSIFSNGMLGIDHGGNGVTSTNVPTLSLAQSAAGVTSLRGALDGALGATFTLEFFLSDECHASGYGEGRTPIGTTIVTTDATGHAEIATSFALAVTSPMVITATATDSSGKTWEFSACTPVILNRPPVAICRDVTVSTGVSCDAVVLAAEVDAGSYDPDGGALTLTLTPAGPFAVGTTSVRLTVIDGNGTMSNCSANVTVIDDTLPGVACPATIEQPLAYGRTSARVTYDPPSAMDNCPGPITSCDIPSGSEFDAGSTLVTCTATDASGNVSTCSFQVRLVTPEAATQQLAASVQALVADGTLSSGMATSLTEKLDAALQKLNAGNPTAAANQIEAFIKQVEALVRSGQLSTGQGGALIDAARSVLAQL